MTQNQINREVAKATGETVEFVRNFGFSLNIVPPRFPRPRLAGQIGAKHPHRRRSMNRKPCIAA